MKYLLMHSLFYDIYFFNISSINTRHLQTHTANLYVIFYEVWLIFRQV